MSDRLILEELPADKTITNNHFDIVANISEPLQSIRNPWNAEQEDV